MRPDHGADLAKAEQVRVQEIRFGHRLGADGPATHSAPFGCARRFWGCAEIHESRPWNSAEVTEEAFWTPSLSGARCIARP